MEFNFKKGILVATLSGILSACFAFALQAGKHINETSLAAGTNPIWVGLPTLTILLLGGFTTNFVWCILLNFKNKTVHQYFAARAKTVGGKLPILRGATQMDIDLPTRHGSGF